MLSLGMAYIIMPVRYHSRMIAFALFSLSFSFTHIHMLYLFHIHRHCHYLCLTDLAEEKKKSSDIINFTLCPFLHMIWIIYMTVITFMIITIFNSLLLCAESEYKKPTHMYIYIYIQRHMGTLTRILVSYFQLSCNFFLLCWNIFSDNPNFIYLALIRLLFVRLSWIMIVFCMCK